MGTDTTTYAYTYDLAGRLTEVERDGVTEQAYGYDANGNRTSLTTAGGVVTATYDAQDRLLTYGSTSYTYTANGELRAKIQGADTTRYTYDVLGNLLAVDRPSGPDLAYVVDAVGRRASRSPAGSLRQNGAITRTRTRTRLALGLRLERNEATSTRVRADRGGPVRELPVPNG